jgi:GNAT superfamily N-acetyltransferase
MHPAVKTPVAVAVLSYPQLSCAARNLATDNRYAKRGDRATAQRINREVLILSRIVVTPEFRCAGVATLLIRELLARTTARYVECSTAMGRYSRFLSHAGFREVPQTSGPSEAALGAWAEMHRVPPAVALDLNLFARFIDGLSVRGRREARRVIWRHYHQFVVHRRTYAPAPKKVPPHHSPHWPPAMKLAATRLTDRPSYWIAGPLGASDEPQTEPESQGVTSA